MCNILLLVFLFIFYFYLFLSVILPLIILNILIIKYFSKIFILFKSRILIYCYITNKELVRSWNKRKLKETLGGCIYAVKEQNFYIIINKSILFEISYLSLLFLLILKGKEVFRHIHIIYIL